MVAGTTLFLLGIAPLVSGESRFAFATLAILGSLPAVLMLLRPRLPPHGVAALELGLVLALGSVAFVGNSIVVAQANAAQAQRDTEAKTADAKIVELNETVKALTGAVGQALEELRQSGTRSPSSAAIQEIIQAVRDALPSKATATQPPLTEGPAPFRTVGIRVDRDRANVGDIILITVSVRNISTVDLSMTPDPLVVRPTSAQDLPRFFSPVALSGTRPTVVSPGQTVDLPVVPLHLDYAGKYFIYGAAATSTLPYRSFPDENWYNTYWSDPLEASAL